jgi:hypothetical protein
MAKPVILVVDDEDCQLALAGELDARYGPGPEGCDFGGCPALLAPASGAGMSPIFLRHSRAARQGAGHHLAFRRDAEDRVALRRLPLPRTSAVCSPRSRGRVTGASLAVRLAVI